MTKQLKELAEEANKLLQDNDSPSLISIYPAYGVYEVEMLDWRNRVYVLNSGSERECLVFLLGLIHGLTLMRGNKL